MVFKVTHRVYKISLLLYKHKYIFSRSWKTLMNFLLFWHDEICCDIDVKVFLKLQYRIYSGHSIY